MPLTPPPRRHPRRRRARWRCVGLDAPRPARVVLGVRPRQVAVEDVAARQRQLALEVERRLGLEARPPVRRRAQAVLDRLGEHASSDRSVAATPRASRRGPRRTAGPACAARTASASAAPRGRLRDRGSSGRSASGSRSRTAAATGSPPAAACDTRPQLRVRSRRHGTSRRTPPRIHGRVAQPRQPSSSMLTFSWAPSGARLGRPLAEQPGRACAGRHSATTWRSADRRPPRRNSAPRPCRPSASTPHLGAATSSAPAAAARRRERVGDRPHPADRNVPLAGPVADHVVEEAAVLPQDASWARANVPISASVRTTPRTRSSANVSSITSPSGRSNSASKASSSPTRRA